MNIFQHMLFSTAILLIKLFPYKQTRITHKHVLISKFRSITSRLTSRPVKLSPSEQPLSFLWSCLEKSHRTWSYVRSYRPFVVSRMQTFCPALWHDSIAFSHSVYWTVYIFSWFFDITDETCGGFITRIFFKRLSITMSLNKLEGIHDIYQYYVPYCFSCTWWRARKSDIATLPYLMPDSLLDFCTALVLEVLMNLN